MKTIINVLLRYHFFLLFLFLEGVSFIMVISADVEKKNAFFSSANGVAGYFNNKLNNWTSYFALGVENEFLRSENINLKNRVAELEFNQRKDKSFVTDTSGLYRYEYLDAKVIKNSVSKGKNYITIDRGRKEGVEKDFGVLSANGLVGIVVATTDHYSLVITLLHNRFGVSAKLKKNNYFGSVQWGGDNYRYANLYEIPNHLDINIGDTVISSGYSAIFPENINIGMISEIKRNESTNFYDLKIELATDFKSLTDVYIVNNRNRREQILLENITKDEY